MNLAPAGCLKNFTLAFASMVPHFEEFQHAEAQIEQIANILETFVFNTFQHLKIRCIISIVS